MDEVRRYFIREVKHGRMRTTRELREYAKKHKVKISSKELSSMRSSWTPTAIRRNVRQRPASFQTFQIGKLGIVQTDFAYFHENWKNWNRGNIGFAVFVCAMTGRLAVIPLKSRKTESFEESIEAACKGSLFPVVNVLESDRETAILSKNFQARMLEKHGVSFRFMSRFSKAFLAERYIRMVKRKLSTMLETKTGNIERRQWLEFLQPLVEHHNNQVVPGTTFVRNEVSDDNFHDFLDQKYSGSKDPQGYDSTLTFNCRSVDQAAIGQSEWKKRLFKFQIGDRVLASLKSLKVFDKTDKSKTSTFVKASIVGTFSSREFVVEQACLRSTRSSTELVQGY